MFSVITAGCCSSGEVVAIGHMRGTNERVAFFLDVITGLVLLTLAGLMLSGTMAGSQNLILCLSVLGTLEVSPMLRPIAAGLRAIKNQLS